MTDTLKGLGIAAAIAVVLSLVTFATYGSETNEERIVRIRELGVELEPHEEIIDLVYAMRTREGGVAAVFSTAALITKDNACDPRESEGIGSIMIRNEEPKKGELEPTEYFEIDDGYVYYYRPRNLCSVEEEVQELTRRQADRLIESLEDVKISRGN